MKLAERIDQALIKHNLGVAIPVVIESLKPATTIIHANYKTISEGLKHLDEYETDEDGIGRFTAETTGLNVIKLPMVIEDYVIEDIQRVKTGNYQIHFRKK